MLVSDLDNNYVRHPHYSECDTADFPIIFLNLKYFLPDWEEDLYLKFNTHTAFVIMIKLNPIGIQIYKQTILLKAIVIYQCLCYVTRRSILGSVLPTKYAKLRDT